ncbi:hypothetical protein DL546_006428 [Coniochaeta pulveracea]|uniref:acylphosphatase n=1 Tax=Coniochaeta pulveracea TaxID=177199 RepID=A0A420Y7E5_9PEZI|nr:hypothetical protein DL546_006428 [Coniochaeta pulveracea]
MRFLRKMSTQADRTRVYFLAHGGLVQGVGFRYFARERANHHKLTGWVRNTDNNKVEGEAQGHPNSVNNFLKDIDKGPRHSKVVKLDQEQRDIVEDETEFGVHR